MIKLLTNLLINRPILLFGGALAIAASIYGAGVGSGTWIEHRLEASARSELQETIIGLQNQIKTIRDQEALAQSRVSDANDALSELQRELNDLRSRQNSGIDEIVTAFTGRLNEVETSADCRATARDVERVRELVEQLSRSGDDQ